MKTSDFYYDLPHELIAQTPLKNRAKSRMLLLDKKTGEMEDKIFEDIVDYIKPGDTLVLNDTKVLPARLFGHREGKEEATLEDALESGKAYVMKMENPLLWSAEEPNLYDLLIEVMDTEGKITEVIPQRVG